MKPEIKKAWQIGLLTISAYLANYYLRNMLGVLTPEMLSAEVTTKTLAGLLSSTYMLTYAVGQLFNGVLGDVFNPKYMASIGLAAAGLASMAFPFLHGTVPQLLCFAIMGYALSMMRGPLVKIISENTQSSYARIICVFFSFASFAGPLLAGFLAMLFAWNHAFVAAGTIAVLLAVMVYVALTAMERRGIIGFHSVRGRGLRGIFGVFKIEKFGFYMLIACLVEISAIAIYFWIPTYLNESLGFGKTAANSIFTAISTLRSFMPFAVLWLYRVMKERDILMMRISFSMAAGFFLLMLVAKTPWLTLAMLALALLSISISSALLWSIYIPSLGKTGRVSSVNGILDCSGYAAASLANLAFARVITTLSWNGVIVLWSGIGLIGLLGSLCVKTNKKAS